MQMVYTHNRSDSTAIFVSEDGEWHIPVPIALLPEAIRIGDTIELAILPDYRKLEELQGHIQSLLNSVTALKTGPNLKEQGYRALVTRVLRALARERDGGFWFKSLDHAAEQITAALMGRKQ